MRVIRLAFVILLAIILVGIALANRQLITVNLFPANFGQFLGGTWSLTMPAFIALLLAILFGVIIGFIWEWLRETSMRAELRSRASELARLEQEVGHLRKSKTAHRDEVLTILDEADTAGKREISGAVVAVPTRG